MPHQGESGERKVIGQQADQWLNCLVTRARK
jgi:hypothetical protein